MSFDCICPNCGKKIPAEEDWIGQRQTCPGCQRQVFIRKDRRLSQVGDSSKETNQPVTSKSSLVDKSNSKPAGPTAKKPQLVKSEPASPPVKVLPSKKAVEPENVPLDKPHLKIKEQGNKCPECNHHLEAGAVVCVFCGYNIQTGQKTNTTNESGDESSALAAKKKVLEQTPPASQHGCANTLGGFLGLLIGFIVWRFFLGGIIGLIIVCIIVVPIATAICVIICVAIQTFFEMIFNLGKR